LGPEPGVSEELQEQRVRQPAIHDIGALDPALDGARVRFHLGQHTALDDAVPDELVELGTEPPYLMTTVWPCRGSSCPWAVSPLVLAPHRALSPIGPRPLPAPPRAWRAPFRPSPPPFPPVPRPWRPSPRRCLSLTIVKARSAPAQSALKNGEEGFKIASRGWPTSSGRQGGKCPPPRSICCRGP